MELTYNHRVPVQLRFNDADALGHINNSVYFSFYDLGKTEYFKAHCNGYRQVYLYDDYGRI